MTTIFATLPEPVKGTILASKLRETGDVGSELSLAD
jgi:hypothetical protein